MDPKMDSGIVCKYYSVDEAIDDGAAPVPISFDRTVDVHCTVDIMDHLLSCEVIARYTAIQNLQFKMQQLVPIEWKIITLRGAKCLHLGIYLFSFLIDTYIGLHPIEL